MLQYENGSGKNHGVFWKINWNIRFFLNKKIYKVSPLSEDSFKSPESFKAVKAVAPQIFSLLTNTEFSFFDLKYDDLC